MIAENTVALAADFSLDFGKSERTACQSVAETKDCDAEYPPPKSIQWVTDMDMKIARQLFQHQHQHQHQHLLVCAGVFGLVAAALVSIGCQSVPVSERRQLLLVSES